MDILCIGLMVCDIIIKPMNKKIFEMDAVRIDSLKIASGGDAFNCAINTAKLGLDVGLVGKVGNDVLGTYLANEAEKSGIYIGGILKSDQLSTSTCIVMVDKSGERHFAYYGMANDSLCLKDIDEELLKNSKIVHLGSAMILDGLDGDGIVELFKKAKVYGAITSMDVTWDSTGQWLEKIEDALYCTDIFMPSYNEAKMISGCETPKEIRKFFEKYAIKVLAVKLGADGCYITDFVDEYFIKTFKNVKVVDTTGAGDAFASGFLTGMIKGWDIYRCGLFGNAAASLCVAELGATTGTKTIGEVIGFIKSNADEKTGSMF